MVSNKNGIDYLLELNKAHSHEFTSPGIAAERRKYRGEHPTEIAALKCMDGRLHLPVMTNTALGIIQPWRNLGGKFDLGWPFFGATIKDWRDYAIAKGRNGLILVTYHYSRGDKHRGCRGFNYDSDAALEFAKKTKEDFDRALGKTAVYTILCGIETDWESLILHGADGKVVDLATITETSESGLRAMLRDLYPDMSERILMDFLPLVLGNIVHVSEIRKSERPLAAADHREWVLGVGRGFDWLHEINTALIVGPFDPKLSEAIATAANLIKGNWQEGRVEGRDLVLLSSAPYRDVGLERPFAVAKAQFLNRFALEVIEQEVPELLPQLHQLTVVVNMHTRALEVLDSKSATKK